MANVLHPQIDFHPRPVSHSPSPFGFGFGLGPTASMGTPSWVTPTPGHTNPAAFHQLASSIAQSATRPPKRRLDPEEESENGRYPISRDESMDRSPTPERPKRAAPKRARVVNTADAASKSDPSLKENKSSSGAGDDDVDIGVLLASLPPQSLLPLLSSLLKAKPSLKATILPLIPRPTLEIAVQALTESAKRLREAYPYSSTPLHSLSAFDAAARSSLNPTFGQSSQMVLPAMRNSYIISRLRPHVSDYVSTCMSYFPYFSCIPPPSNVSVSAPTATTNSASTIQSLHKDKFHPSETFLFLLAVTNQIVNQPSLSIGELAPMILPRLSEEWRTWVDKVDELVNAQARMFGSETVRGWERGLDELAECKAPEISEVMRGIRDNWVTKVGWLIGRTLQQPMDEL
ncbi:hypothetical protein M413DRAFT_440004 [Hebeloma cylindrosporum]|uniref:Tethering factor for nuclear proteasome STS1 n=1 Tax=Hebeloma cylindrosporum TaxID=76867 RepID=A0A0C2YET8_HEBCY|nr:hypothetical protein M413DRAFT_440004 [Hebeloma cylindrosporum h7]